MRILVLNAGSSTLKASAIDDGARDPSARTDLEWGDDATRAEDRGAGLDRVLTEFAAQGVPRGSIEAVGHRVVHGGERFTTPAVLDEAAIVALEGISDLAPLHNPVAIETIRAARAALPDVPHVAAFDTAFHASLPDAARTYALPEGWRREHGLRRYGFHGLSVAWAVRRAGELIGARRVVVAHLGSGCSVTAVDDGRSVMTSMGMTPLEGLVMGTRAGSIDPGIVLRLIDAGLSPAEVADGLDHRSGLLGLSGATADVRRLLAAEADGDPGATRALDVFVRSAASWIAAATTALPSLDALVLTGGIGEHAAPIRERIVGRLGVLGIQGRLTETGEEDAVLTPVGARPAVIRIAAREDLVIAAAVAELVG